MSSQLIYNLAIDHIKLFKDNRSMHKFNSVMNWEPSKLQKSKVARELWIPDLTSVWQLFSQREILSGFPFDVLAHTT